jgi:hypothetical protein
MIVCCDLYDWLQQLPSGAGMEHLFYFVYALENFVQALDIFLCYVL